jgi:hypothetical protein
MTYRKPRGGEPDAARLLDLARSELLNQVLPQLEGDGRYRARLIANALKIAGHEMEATVTGDSEAAELLRQLAEVARPELSSSNLPPGTSLTEALRRGALDGDPELHALLARLTDRRRTALG